MPLEGIVDTSAYLLDAGIELMTTSGTVQVAPYSEVKAVCFASEGGREDLFTASSRFERRPRVPGLWVRFHLRDGDVLDGILSQNLLEWPAAGYLLTPPRAGATRQRVFLPRAAATETHLLGVVGTSAGQGEAARQRAARESQPRGIQLRIFDQ